MPPLRDESSGAEPASPGVTDRIRAAETALLAPAVPDYELLRRIGRGSYGEVWLARGVTGILRAVKIVWRERFPDAAPFEREFRGLTEFAAISLEEPVQLALLHVGRNAEAGYFYSVMELADDAEHGRTIEPATYVPLTLAELRVRRGRLPAEECVRIGVELARALAALHRHGLVHRDIKPSNVILVGGRPKLADIGLVAPVADAHTFIGTEGFIPPEGPGTPTADVYAFGKLLYELVTGLDRAEFPRLPDRLETLPDAGTLMRLNGVILRACDPDAKARHPDATALLADLTALQAGLPPRQTGRARRATLAAAVVLLLVVGAWWRPWQGPAVTVPPEATPSEVTPARVIAVLPFDNLSADPANALLADGIHVDLIDSLNLVADLQVIPRTSVLAFRNHRDTSSEVARKLGVGYLLEGTLRREKDRLIVTCHLIRMADDRQIWRDRYEVDTTDLFAMQGQLAQTIARALSGVILPSTQIALTRRPTRNIAAYEKYVQGREAGFGAVAEPLLQAAIELDPEFAAAWCLLAQVHSYAIFSSRDTSPARFAKADAAIQRAVDLAPDTPDVIRALGVYHYHRWRDYARAREQFERLRALQPNDASVYHWLSKIEWRQDQCAGSLANARRSVALDPANRSYSQLYRVWLRALRRWPELLAEQRRFARLEPGALGEGDPRLPGALGDRVVIARTESWMSRDTGPLEALVAGSTPEERESTPVLSARLWIARERGDVKEYAALDRRLPEPSDREAIILIATDYIALGDRAAGIRRLGELPKQLRAGVAEDPKNQAHWIDLGRVEAMLGNADAAKAAVRTSIGLIPEDVDPVIGALYSRSMAVTYAWAGDTDFAVAELQRLVGAPAARLSGYEMRTLTTFHPLRGHPRFEALANDPRNDAPLL